ncbi:hypothetical protein ACFSSA_15585 [Luteolibacter algae]|uniref:Uncharacterized protein n=1 Tax=Luteolibacter algae TaxID=454151 RepID=A0ABW5DB03_9BACT
MAFPESWHVRSRSRECSVTEVRFKEGDIIITALFPDPESSGYLRKDFSEKAWKELPEDDKNAFSYWKTKFTPVAAVENVQTVTKQSAEDLLRTMVEEDQEHTENTRYILAVMLERQKLLRETDTQSTAGGILRIYEHRKTGEVYIVKDPNIPLDEVEKIQEEVIQLLSPPAPEINSGEMNPNTQVG